VVEKNYRLQDIQLSKNPRFAARATPQGKPQYGLPISVVACLTEASPPRSLSQREAGGEYRARTGDLLVANQALSQLS
jgi:hypothetical protein